MRQRVLFGAFLALFLAAATQVCRAEPAYALLEGTSTHPELSGTVILKDTGRGLEVQANVQNAPPGEHGFHIHFSGNCGDDAELAGGHFNPDGSPHGDLINQSFREAHAGDLGNLKVGEDGTGSYEWLIAGLSVSRSAYAVAGRAFILHEKSDNFGQPAGNAGARIACGTIVIGTIDSN